MKKTLYAVVFLCIAVSCTKYLAPSNSQLSLINKAQTDAIAVYRDSVYNDAAYEVVADELNMIVTFDEMRMGGKPLVELDKILIKGFNTRRDVHRSRGVLGKKMLATERNYMQSYFTPRVKAEQAIK